MSTRPRAARAAPAALWYLLMALFAAGGAAAAPDGSRVALVIGNSAYRHVPALGNPANDARGVARTLQGLGFTLVGGGAQTDLDKAGLEKAVRAFGDALKSGSVGLFYYAGHGLQVRGENYLVPVSANPTKEADLDFELVDANLVLRQMEEANTRLNIVILDACRNNPFAGSAVRAISTGLAQMQAPEGTIISYATQPGNVAADGGSGHSPFAAAIMATLQTPNLDVLEAFNRIGVEVKKQTGGNQQPWVANSPIDGEFYFAAAPAGAAGPGGKEAAGGDDPELLFWKSIADSRSPADYKAYLDTYPNGRFASLARVRAAPAVAQAAQSAAAGPQRQLQAPPAPPKAPPAPAKPPAAPATAAAAPASRPAGPAPPPAHDYARELQDYGVAPTTQINPQIHGATPTSIPGARVIATDALIDLRQRGQPILIDAVVWGDEHPTIQGALWLPFSGHGPEPQELAATRLGQVLDHLSKSDKSRSVVFFCAGPTCWAGYNAALRAIQLGYRNVYWYRGGLAAWQEAGQPTGRPVLTIREHVKPD